MAGLSRQGTAHGCPFPQAGRRRILRPPRTAPHRTAAHRRTGQWRSAAHKLAAHWLFAWPCIALASVAAEEIVPPRHGTLRSSACMPPTRPREHNAFCLRIRLAACVWQVKAPGGPGSRCAHRDHHTSFNLSALSTERCPLRGCRCRQSYARCQPLLVVRTRACPTSWTTAALR